MLNRKLMVTFSPHVRVDMTTDKLMMHVVYALLPAVAVSVWYYGFYALKTYVITIAATLLWEYAHQKLAKKGNSLGDNSALVTGILLAMNLPPSSPWWLCVVGGYVAIIVAKMVFGGLGQNPFNPALVGRIFLLIAFPVEMTTWIQTNPITDGFIFDAVSTATPLGLTKTEVLASGKILTQGVAGLTESFVGSIGGSLGEDSALAVMLGGFYMMYKRIISWHIPFVFIGSTLFVTGLYWLGNPGATLDPVQHALSGGLMLGAFFMATDYASSPITSHGKIVFALGCGILTAVIRLFGGYPEGVGFAILIMNSTVPLLDYYLRPKSFGEA